VVGYEVKAGPRAIYEQWKRRLEFHLYETMANLRIAELFDIIIEYPDSLPALTDLKACLERTRLHPARLISTLTASLHRRLLQPGAMTADILGQFISTVKALRHLDPALPAATALEVVGHPIKEYLRGRSDTIRCIVTALTDDPELLQVRPCVAVAGATSSHTRSARLANAALATGLRSGSVVCRTRLARRAAAKVRRTPAELWMTVARTRRRKQTRKMTSSRTELATVGRGCGRGTGCQSRPRHCRGRAGAGRVVACSVRAIATRISSAC
jgi:hypothetical protein